MNDVKALPADTESRNRDITKDFSFTGAWVYANSRHVMETSTSAAVIITYARSCHIIPGCCPMEIRLSIQAVMRNDGTVKKSPRDIFFNDVRFMILFNPG